MAAVRIDSGGLPSAVGVEGNALMRVIGKWQSIADGRFPDDCAALLQMVDETDRLRLWEKRIGGLTFKDRNEFLQKQVLIDYALTEQALSEIVDRLRHGETVTMRAMRMGKEAKPLADVGHPMTGSNVDNINKGTQGGTSASYLAGVLKRDHPEIAEQLAAGKFRSVRAAAKAAGIVTELTPLDQLRRWWKKASVDERASFCDENNLMR